MQNQSPPHNQDITKEIKEYALINFDKVTTKDLTNRYRADAPIGSKYHDQKEKSGY